MSLIQMFVSQADNFLGTIFEKKKIATAYF